MDEKMKHGEDEDVSFSADTLAALRDVLGSESSVQMPVDTPKASQGNGEEEDEVSFSLSTLAALRDVLGSGNDAASSQDSADGGMSIAAVTAMFGLQRRHHDDSSSSEDDDDEDEEEHEKVNHAEYYRKLFPERYKDENVGSAVQNIENPVGLVTVDDQYVKSLLLKAFEGRANWTIHEQKPSQEKNENENENEEPVEYDFHWGEYEHIDWYSERFAGGNFIASCYYNRKGLIRKGHLAHIMEKWHIKYPQRQRIIPKSYILSFKEKPSGGIAESEEQFNQVFQEGYGKLANKPFTESAADPDSRNPDFGNVWILKPSLTNQATGISLVRSLPQLKRAIQNADEMERAGEFVLQQYIEPLLLDGRKFHLRVFMLLNGNLTAYVAPDFLAIFSLEKYQGADLDKTRAHLTNIAHQEVLSKEDEYRCMRLFDETKQDMVDAGLVHDVEEATAKIEQVRQRVFDMARETMEAVSLELTFQARDNCFELFGLDFMIDPQWNVWLLEANAEPDLSKAGDRLQHVIDQVVRDTLVVVVDQSERFQVQADSEIKQPKGLVKVFDKKKV